MSNNSFSFRQFTIEQDRCAMKVGTDGTLLGAWASLPEHTATTPRLLDIGTGTGLIALMLAQRRWLMLLTSTRRLSDSRERTSVVLPLPRASKCSTPPFSTSVSRPISPMMPSYAILPSSITPSSVQRKSGRWRDIRYHLIFTRSLPVLLRCSLRRDISLSSSL